MRILNLVEFLEIINSAKGCVWMQDGEDNEYDLKSELGMQKATSRLMNPDNDLELYASDPNEAFRLVAFLRKQNKAA